MLRKAPHLLRLAVSNPVEAFDRIVNLAEARREGCAWRQPGTPEYTLEGVLQAFHDLFCETSAPAVLQEDFEMIARRLERELEAKAGSLKFARAHDADLTWASLCYAVCRVLRPSVVIETGVAHGVTSLFILQALAWNAAGALLSIDLPPLAGGVDASIGVLVPGELRPRWTLLRGCSRRLLPKALHETGAVDVFVHDSLHTVRTMRFELHSAFERLRRPGAILADDVHCNAVFDDFVALTKPHFAAVVRQSKKSAMCGAAVYL